MEDQKQPSLTVNEIAEALGIKNTTPNMALVQYTAANFIGGLLTGEGSYSLKRQGLTYPHAIYLSRHPLESDGPVEFFRIVGSLGYSSAIGQFVHQVFEELFGIRTDREKRFIFWRVKEPGLEDPKRNILVEFRLEDSGLISGGMTNYSGEGSSALETCFSFVVVLAQLLNIPVEVRDADMDAYRSMLNEYWEISVAEAEQREGTQ